LNAFKNLLDSQHGRRKYLNMFKSATAKGAATRAHLLDIALNLFREKGFDETTMREIALGAGLSLGAAYHYFPSKEAIILAYYAHVQRQHIALAEQALASTEDLRDRLAAAMHTKLDVLAQDRRIMGALLRFTGDPSHPLSFLGRTARPIQLASIRVFDRALEGAGLPQDLRRIAPTALWALHMGILLYFLYDASPSHARTRRLVDDAMGLVVRMLPVMRFPLFKPVRARLVALLDEAGLVLDPRDVPAMSLVDSFPTDLPTSQPIPSTDES
jgi:AcrR family transcriptional regulator